MLLYYKSKCGKLISLNQESNMYYLKSSIERNNLLSKREVDSLELESIKKEEFNRLLNEYFKTVEHQ